MLLPSGNDAALALAMINVLWAGSAIAAKIALGEGGQIGAGKLGPFTLAFTRFAPASRRYPGGAYPSWR